MADTEKGNVPQLSEADLSALATSSEADLPKEFRDHYADCLTAECYYLAAPSVEQRQAAAASERKRKAVHDDTEAGIEKPKA